MLTTAQPAGDLKIRFRPGLRLSDEAFWRLCRANPDLNLERSSRGELVVQMSPTGLQSDFRELNLAFRLRGWYETSQTGRPCGSNAGFILPNSAIRSPDAAWISQERWNQVPQEERENFGKLCPDFVVEIRSLSDRKGALRAKMREYIDNGARLGWLIDPTIKAQTVEIYRPDRDVEILRHPETISADPVVPGFTLDLAGILS